MQSIREESFQKRIQAECEYSRGRDPDDTLYVIGSVWSHSSDIRNVPFLDNWNSKRNLNLNDWQDEWNRNYRFAAVRKDLKSGRKHFAFL